MISLICPVCSKELELKDKTYSCQNRHSFDISKEGYVNFLTGGRKSGDLTGDNAQMASARRAFLEKGYYDFLSDKICDIILGYNSNPKSILDISCGEGYYTNKISQRLECSTAGFDISKAMIRLAAKKYKSSSFFVANMSKIPVKSDSVDVGVHICAPFCESEFSRILSNDGILLSAVPGKRHLFSLKAAVYDNPYENNEDIADYKSLELIDKISVSDSFNMPIADVKELFSMTPYYYKTRESDRQRLDALDSLEVEFEFIIRVFRQTKKHG